MSGAFACPVDGTTLVPIERVGIEIDHCPSCRGVWLDRGELDKILERSAGASAAPQPEPFRQPRYQDAHRGHDTQHGHKHPHKRRKSFLEELFD